jgi:xyloglucan-specific endo-beta-1,4-glucanase
MTQVLTDKFAWYGDNGYYFNNNMWGMDSGSGYQVTRVESTQPEGVVWHVDWNWNGGDNNVKSYPYSGRELPTKRLIRDIQSLPSSASWTYSGPDVRANVAFDLFTASDPEHENWHGDYELMIWCVVFVGIRRLVLANHAVGYLVRVASIPSAKL